MHGPFASPPSPQVLLDGNFIHMALKVKMDIKDRVKKLLLGENFACYVPRCVPRVGIGGGGGAEEDSEIWLVCVLGTHPRTTTHAPDPRTRVPGRSWTS